jgi:hypothetical protein
MSTADTQAGGSASQEQADFEAVLRHAFQGEPLDAEVARRVRAQAARVTEEIFRVHGLIDDEKFQNLLRDDDDDER